MACCHGHRGSSWVPKKLQVILSEEQRQSLHQLIASGTASARTLAHARILLKADESEAGPAWGNALIALAVEVSELTVSRVRKRFVEGGLAAALHRKVQERRRERRLDGVQEAHLIALTCSQPPEGHSQWSLRLLADRMVALGHVDTLSHETVRQVLKKGSSSPGKSNNGVSPPNRTASS